MSLMACVIISRLTNYAAKGLVSSLYYTNSARHLSTSSPLYGAPNVVVYASDNEGKYFKINSLLNRIFSPDSLAIYPLTRESLLKTDAAWLQNVRGLVLDDCDRLSREEAARLLAFFHQGGRILDLGSNLCKHIGISRGDSAIVEQESERPTTKVRNDIVVRSKGYFAQKVLTLKPEEISIRTALNDSQGKIVALEVNHNSSKGRAVLSRVPFHLAASDLKVENSELFEKQTSNRDNIVLDLMKRLEFVPKNYSKQKRSAEPASPTTKADSIFVFGKSSTQVVDTLQSVDQYKGIQAGAESLKGFNSKDYFSILKTRVLGNSVIYQTVTENTMKLVKTARNHLEAKNIGLVGIADRQTSGIGRAGNKWLSPAGCAMFTFSFACDVNSGIGRRLPLVQSIAALSCVTAIKDLVSKSSKDGAVDIRIKWPNDVYFDGKTKLGGILVQSTILGDTMSCLVGIGLNLSNEEPTVCLNKILSSNGVATISREQLIAGILNNFENYIDAVNAFKLSEVIDAYCNNWLHADQRVVVREECQTDYCNVPLRRKQATTNMTAEPPSSLRSGHVRRIDEYGYLVVEFQDRSTASLHPDGNSFDAMNGLILPKLTQPDLGASEKAGADGVPKLGDANYPRTKDVRGELKNREQRQRCD